MSSRAIPIVIGVGDIKNRSLKVADAIEPLQLMLQATQLALSDTGLSKSDIAKLQSGIDHIGVVNTWTWQYTDLPSSIAEALGIEPTYKFLSHHGGDSPAKLFDEATRRIALGEAKVALITGGEALASLAACAKANQLPPPGWTKPDPKIKAVSLSDVTRSGDNVGTRHSIGLPIHVYPLYENAFRAHSGQSILDNNQESASLYASFAEVASQNPFAWNYGLPPASAADIGTVSKTNRMICFPYPLLMNAFNTVNLSASCILTSTVHARTLGIPESKWIYPLGGSGTSESPNFWERPSYHSSPAISSSLDAALAVSGVSKGEIDIFDFYSCFPIVPKLCCEHLGLPLVPKEGEKPITLLGGLTSFGGAGNNYSMHVLTALVRELRTAKTKGEEKKGLVLANGGALTYQHAVVLSSSPRPRGSSYPEQNPLPELLELDVPSMAERAEGEGVVETYTVEFARDGRPKLGFVVGRLLGSGERFVANCEGEKLLGKEIVGRRGWVKPVDRGRNAWSFERVGKL